MEVYLLQIKPNARPRLQNTYMTTTLSKTFKVHLIFVCIFVLLMPRSHLHRKLSCKSQTRTIFATWSGAAWQLRGTVKPRPEAHMDMVPFKVFLKNILLIPQDHIVQ